MTFMSRRMRQFFEDIRNSDEAIRKRWLIALSGASMVIVIALWVGYLNLVVQPSEDVAALHKEPGLAQTFGLGVKVTAGEIKKGSVRTVDYFREKFGGSNEIMIEKQKRNFLLEDLPPVTPTRLP